MQLWSAYNTVSYQPTMTVDDVARLEVMRPTAIAMYAPSLDQVYAFWQSLPADVGATAPDCTSVPFLGIGSPQAHICVTHLMR
jgi:hypothetical protein